VAQEPSGGGDDDVGAHAEASQFLFVAVAVVSAVYGETAHTVEIVAESLHCLVYLLCQLARGTHYDAVYCVFGVVSVVELAEYGQQVGGCLACSCLCHSQHIVSLEYLRYALFLYRSARLEMHVIQCVEHVVV